jgi:hypothetical protein
MGPKWRSFVPIARRTFLQDPQQYFHVGSLPRFLCMPSLSAHGERTVFTHNVTTGSRRDRLVYFRLSEVEFREMLNACNTKGARSISDLARSALQEFIKPRPTGQAPELVELIGSLRDAIQDMQSSIQELRSTIRQAGTPAIQPCGKSQTATASPTGDEEFNLSTTQTK